jgi:predicted esterase
VSKSAPSFGCFLGWRVVLLAVSALVSPAFADDNASAAAVDRLRVALADKAGEGIITGDFMSTPLTKTDAAKARELLFDAHAKRIRAERAEEMRAGRLSDGELEMPFVIREFGKKPASGRSVWISLHGGGGAPKQVNDSQWENQKRLYSPDEGLYVVPRAPTNNWNLWHEPHIDRLFARLIENLVILQDADPDRVYVMGYSAGGDGVYQLAPRMADVWAGAAMMAGHPNDASPLGLRNVPFALQVGGLDAAYNRNKIGAEWGDKLDQLQKADPDGYPHFVKIHEGKGHWMNLEDKAALPWMAKHTRNPVSKRIVWKQSPVTHDSLYWLAVPPGEAKPGSLVSATLDGQTIDITDADNVTHLLIRVDDRMLDLDQPVRVTHKGRVLSEATAPRTIATLQKTLASRHDPKLMFAAEIAVTIPRPVAASP